MSIKTKVGEHHIHISSGDQLLLNECKELFSFSDNGFPEADLQIHLKRGIDKVFTSYNVTVSSEGDNIIYIRDDFEIVVDRYYQHAVITVHNSLALKHSIMTLYSGLITHQNWGILLHSSCVLEGYGAHIFTGRSGAGKSTAAKLSSPRPLLADEASIIRVDPAEGVLIYHSPFRSELMDSGGDGPFPLISLNLLHQSPLNRRAEMGKAEALLTLMDKVFYWSMNKEDVRKITWMMKNIIQQTELYHLYFKKDPTFWEMMTS